ncbi:glucose-1-phosphate cytidylyltransferase [Vallicoccus soli]|uniref:Glucose-1-phosphate cytidylyltransferase n=1 Tax=Vallicoccus soli TaxID=2339232 RepID=A0A3A3Z0T9_9ACTN|nr:glucose-1-phosphate cytidylyltransferase [Vallicoccus soli]RJK97870.1 glucose-1-phosphate cytidylyltransferase [Vallicoccus soli]
MDGTTTTPGAADRLLDPKDIPVVILCGGMGTRLREASEKLPKPLVDIGGKPILWHVMKTYSHHGYRRFVLALGYKSDLIKRWFLDLREQTSDFTLTLGGDHRPVFHTGADVEEDWEVTFVETGLLSGTGARIRRVAPYLKSDVFALTYGDGIGDVDLTAQLRHHVELGRAATVTGVHPTSRFGEIRVDDAASRVVEFNEKPAAAGWVSGGFFLFQRSFVDDYVSDDPGLMLEAAPLQQVARDGQLSVFPHEGFWAGMDTFRDWTDLNARWDAGKAPWKVWDA